MVKKYVETNIPHLKLLTNLVPIYISHQKHMHTK